jgi:hypothetical protein
MLLLWLVLLLALPWTASPSRMMINSPFSGDLFTLYGPSLPHLSSLSDLFFTPPSRAAHETAHLTLSSLPGDHRRLCRVAHLLAQMKMVLGRHQEAVWAIDDVPRERMTGQLWFLKAIAVGALGGNPDEALYLMELAVRLDPALDELHYNIGYTHSLRGRRMLALSYYRAELDFHPDSVKANNNAAVVHLMNGHCNLALPMLWRAAESNKRATGVADHRISNNLAVCSRMLGKVDELPGVVEMVRENGGATRLRPRHCPEYPWIHSPMECKEIVRQAEAALLVEAGGVAEDERRVFTEAQARSWAPGDGGRRLVVALVHNLGFTSSVPTTWLLLPLLSSQRMLGAVKLVCVSVRGPADSPHVPPMQEYRTHACESFHEVPDDDRAIARLIASEGADIAVDLQGLVGRTKEVLWALHPAPLQVSFHGYPGTLGQPGAVDYVIGDRHVTPPHYAGLYYEKLLLMPHTYFAAGHASLHSEVIRAPADLAEVRRANGLPERGPVACSFNNYYKFSPALLDGWMEVLRSVPDAVMWFIIFESEAPVNLREAARARGVDPARLVFSPKFPKSAEYTSKAACDLFLDSPFYNGHSTTADALWAGVPVLTSMGTADWVSRVSSSLLHAIGMEDLVVPESRYVKEAISILGNATRTQELRARLAKNRSSKVLFDTSRFAASMDHLYAAAWESWRATGGMRHHIVLVGHPKDDNSSEVDWFRKMWGM